LLSIYDPRTLQLINEVELPGRALVNPKKQNLDISADGKYAYIYNMTPASSVVVVDATKQDIEASIDLPGCALAFAFGNKGFASICADGSLTTITLEHFHADQK
jgi:methylamine dehydrogenase heavy chain